MLEKFKLAKGPEIARLLDIPLTSPVWDPWPGDRINFTDAILAKGPGAVIAEYKRASPSKGIINLDLEPADVADIYSKCGAAAISVLTEEEHFQGRLDFLEIMSDHGVPLLRKDFIFNPLQVAMTAATPASALLLIVRMFDTVKELAEMIEDTEDKGMEAVVEIFTERELFMAREAGAKIIQVNNRDLNNLSINLKRSEELVALRDKGPEEERIWISASGIDYPDQVKGMAALGFDAVLVGTSIMASDDPAEKLACLTGRDIEECRALFKPKKEVESEDEVPAEESS